MGSIVQSKSKQTLKFHPIDGIHRFHRFGIYFIPLSMRLNVAMVAFIRKNILFSYHWVLLCHRFCLEGL